MRLWLCLEETRWRFHMTVRACFADAPIAPSFCFPIAALKVKRDHLNNVKVPIFGLRAEQDAIILGPRTQALKEHAGTGDWIDAPGGHNTVWDTQAACTWLQSTTRT